MYARCVGFCVIVYIFILQQIFSFRMRYSKEGEKEREKAPLAAVPVIAAVPPTSSRMQEKNGDRIEWN